MASLSPTSNKAFCDIVEETNSRHSSKDGNQAPTVTRDDNDDEDDVTIIETPAKPPERPEGIPLGTYYYFGNAMVEGYATTGSSMSSLQLNYGDNVQIFRQKFDSNNNTSMKKQKSRNKENRIVTFRNPRGYDVGRIAEASSDWMSKALDLSIVKFSATVLSCPTPLRLNGDIYLSIDVYVHNSAFFRLDSSINFEPASSSSKITMGFKPDALTEEEKKLQNRKGSLRKLFKVAGLKPINTDKNDIDKRKGSKKNQKKNISFVKTIKDDDKESLEDGAEMTADALNVVYAKAVQHDAYLPEMEPSDLFKLSLRPYQKQALHWMYKMEHLSVEEQARTEVSMDPLWEEYNFPPEPGCLATGEKFYYNPHSGELSLDFPKAITNSSGGILADEMGLGKTIMISSLILTSLPPSLPQAKAKKDNSNSHQLYEIQSDSSDDESYRPWKRQRLQSYGLDGKDFVSKMNSRSSTTLVVAPVTLLSQWRDELLRTSGNALRVIVYHGNSRYELQQDADVVVTSYGILSSEFDKADDMQNLSSNVLFGVQWQRCILDEAHTIKSRQTKVSKACYAVTAKKRWCLTGTPIVNRLEDLYSLLHFIQFKPWGVHSFFRSFVTIPFENSDPKALEIVQVILESILLRREKSMKNKDGEFIISLPPKRYTTVRLDFSEQERIIYNRIYENAKAKFQSFSRSGTIRNNFTNVLALLMRLRQAVLHPILAVKGNNEDDENQKSKNIMFKEEVTSLREMVANYSAHGDSKFAEKVMESIVNNKEDHNKECCICLDTLEKPFHLPCMHAACKECILGWIESRGEEASCPICKFGPIQERDLFELIYKPREEEQAEKNIFAHSERQSTPPPKSPGIDTTQRSPSKSVDFVLRRNNFRSSTKLDALMEQLIKVRNEEPKFHCVVFSQFTTFMDLIETVLNRENFAYVRLDGSMSQKQREASLETFNNSERCILVISLKAGGVGLNLTKANHVYLCDVWWNEAIEQQAVDRIHRFGQEREVFVTRFVITDSIEDRMLELQKRKTAIIEAGLGGGKLGKEELELIFGI